MALLVWALGAGLDAALSSHLSTKEAVPSTEGMRWQLSWSSAIIRVIDAAWNMARTVQALCPPACPPGAG